LLTNGNKKMRQANLLLKEKVQDEWSQGEVSPPTRKIEEAQAHRYRGEVSKRKPISSNLSQQRAVEITSVRATTGCWRRGSGEEVTETRVEETDN